MPNMPSFAYQPGHKLAKYFPTTNMFPGVKSGIVLLKYLFCYDENLMSTSGLCKLKKI